MLQRIIACEVFKDALAYLKVDRPDAPVAISYLPSYLHLRPNDLKKRLLERISRSRVDQERIICLYGQCFAGIDEALRPSCAVRVPGGHCFEILLGKKQFTPLIHAQPGTFFMEKELVRNFKTLCSDPLELDDPQMREWYFEKYSQVVYIHQPLDPDVRDQARAVASFLRLPLKVAEADYTDLRSHLGKLLCPKSI